ncbi:hypothetical protein [uncultured Fibrella sp.]
MNQPEYWSGGESVAHAGEYCGWWNERVGYITSVDPDKQTGTVPLT